MCNEKVSFLYTIPKTLLLFSLSVRGYLLAEQQAASDLFEMSLQELMNVEIVSASQKPETLLQSPSNITVITEKQIKEWGSRNLKDVLSRLVGFHVLPDRD